MPTRSKSTGATERKDTEIRADQIGWTTVSPRSRRPRGSPAAPRGQLGRLDDVVDGEKGMDNFARVGEANWTRRSTARSRRRRAARTGLPGLEGSRPRLRDAGRVLGQRRANSGVFLRCHRDDDHRRDLRRGQHLRPAARPDLRHRRDRQGAPRSRRCPRPAASGTPTRSPRAARSGPRAERRDDGRRARTRSSPAARSRCSRGRGRSGSARSRSRRTSTPPPTSSRRRAMRRWPRSPTRASFIAASATRALSCTATGVSCSR